MANNSNWRSMWTLWAIVFQLVGFINAAPCNFDYPKGLLSKSAVTSCHMDIQNIASTLVVCPQEVNGTEYVWHPQPNADEQGHLKTYVSGDGSFSSVPLSTVVRSESKNKLFWMETTRSQRTLHLNLPREELFVVTENRFMFICAPRDFVLTEKLQRHLEHLYDKGQRQKLPWKTSIPLNPEVDGLDKGLGVLMVYRGRQHQPLQGCGSRPSPLFAEGNEVTVDRITGTTSCVVDPMSQSPIGFVCEGKVEPENCMRTLLGKTGEVFNAPRPRRYWKFENHKPWTLVRYFNDLALPQFDGECRCIDPETGAVKAKIEVRRKTEHVCDIASVINNKWSDHISGPLCTVVLHPGSTLTIKIPTEDMDMETDMDIDSDTPPVELMQKRPKYSFKNEILPSDMNMLRQLNTPYGVYVYDEVLYHKALVGDALELDTSLIDKGEIKLKYHLGKSLALRSGQNSFFYEHTFKTGNKYVPSRIRSVVNVSFAFTHDYETVGCDRGSDSAFNTDVSSNYCLTRTMGNGIGDTYECIYHNKMNEKRAGINCGPDEELLPANCESLGYDLSSNKVTAFPASIRNVTPYPVRGFQVFETALGDIPVSHACICVDKRGYEKSRLVIENDHREQHNYGINRETAIHTMLPHSWMPLSEFKLNIEEPSLAFYKMHHLYSQSITLKVGMEFTLRCALQPDILYDADTTVMQPVWLPYSREQDHYISEPTVDGTRLIRVAHNETIATSQDGLYIGYNDVVHTVGYKTLVLISRQGAIIVSKDANNREYVPMTFVCGKAPILSDFSTNSRSYALAKSFARFTWNLVQVNVETTDPYMQGCGVTYESDELFKPETPKVYDEEGREIGCKVDLQAAGGAAFYCPAPYVMDPPGCFNQVSVNGEVKDLSDISATLLASRSSHFVTLNSFSALMEPGETLRHTPLLECRCVTTKGVVLSTIQIENY
ncbi:hypothetical protein BBBOND_0303270 [Babesia bigemina]|uniref:6-Cys domain-containing protein n=1 Tax=Babesia bigemina TaxID=5866 RepID=A0A061D7A7_BABBI|nr:hypothetical protein BBBOND_0303270 [Babesia bigemina]CDR96423.1 hypothetical protein BBBOND_0303270 [Babesia bigemina]|eukprot:XP_012768609.1 hypothetical protein BBBOND_0303270 [Babesia bigemina]